MVRIEVLFPEICNLFGDLFNIKYLKQSIKNCEIIETSLKDTPKFTYEDVDMIYMAPMTEKNQEVVIEKLTPYKENIIEMIEKEKIIFFTGNAVEVLGKYIENEDESKIKGLEILDIYAKRQMMKRLNTLFLGEFDNIKIVGFKSQFTQIYGENEKNYLFKVIKGFGLNKESNLEGIRINNLFANYILGPILPLNPLFTKYILKLLGQKEDIAFEEEAMDAYKIRLAEFEQDNIKL